MFKVNLHIDNKRHHESGWCFMFDTLCSISSYFSQQQKFFKPSEEGITTPITVTAETSFSDSKSEPKKLHLIMMMWK